MACSGRNPYKKIEGFWVSVDYRKDKPFQTLVIGDSILKQNKFGVYWYSCPLLPESNYFKAPGPHWETAFLISIKEDTLLQIFERTETIDTLKYVRMDSLQILRDVLFCDALPKINLPEADQTSSIQLARKALVSNLYIGHLKTGIVQDYPEINQDSVVLQINDELIDLSKVSRFLKEVQSNIDESERDSLIIALYTDENTPMEMLFKIRQTIHEFNPKLTVYRAYIDWDERKFYYKAI